jgi:hypothetical protein
MKVKNCLKAINTANDVIRKLYDYKKGEIDRLDNQTITEATSLIREYVVILSSLPIDIDVEE